MDSVASEPLVIVYKATNLVNGHWYVGFTTKGLRHRENQHRYHRSNASLLQHAINKHGQESFAFEMLADFQGDEELAKIYEREMIEKHRPEYNLNYGGDGGTTHPETRKKISDANKGRAPVFKGREWDPEALDKFRATKARNGKPAPMTGKKMQPHVREALRKANEGRPSNFKGKKHTPEFKAWLSEYKKSNPSKSSDKHKEMARATIKRAHAAIRKPVRCVNDGRVFESAAAASRFYGLRDRTVSRIITGDIRQHRSGLLFEYLPKDVSP